MATCENCGKKLAFGHSRSFSKRATQRSFKPNLQRVAVWHGKRKETKVLCTKCIRTIVKVA